MTADRPPVSGEPRMDLDEAKRQNVAEFLSRQTMKRDHPERLILADALGDLMQYQHEDKYAAALGLLSRLAAHGITLAEARATPPALDVNRLSKALDNLYERRWGPLKLAPGSVSIGGAFAEDIAAEYARLSEQPGEDR